MKKYTIPCFFGNQEHRFDFYAGNPHKSYHPLEFQMLYLSCERSGLVPDEVINSFDQLHKIALKEGCSLETLLEAAMQEGPAAPSHHEQPKIFSSEGNVISINFAGAKKKVTPVETIPATDNPLIKLARKHEFITYEIVEKFCCQLIEGRTFLHNSERRLLFGLIFFAHLVEEEKNYLKRALDLLTNNDYDQFLYNLGVIIDTCGGDLPDKAIKCLMDVFRVVNKDKFDGLKNCLIEALEKWQKEKDSYEINLFDTGSIKAYISKNKL